jgi:hypothetical protein
MKLEPSHIELLEMRTYRNKFAIQVGYQGRPDLLDALQDLIKEGYVINIDQYFNTEIGVLLDVYQLTSLGRKLVDVEEIPALNP